MSFLIRHVKYDLESRWNLLSVKGRVAAVRRALRFTPLKPDVSHSTSISMKFWNFETSEIIATSGIPLRDISASSCKIWHWGEGHALSRKVRITLVVDPPCVMT